MLEILSNHKRPVNIEQLADKMAVEETAHSKWDVSSATISYILLFITLVLVYFHVAFEILGIVAFGGLILILVKTQIKGKKLRNESYEQNLDNFKRYIDTLALKHINKNELLSIIHALADAIEAKDPYTYDHSKKVAEHARGIAEIMNFSKEEVDEIYSAALLHDIGKIGVPERVLLKQGKLDQEEWNFIKAHPERGVSILKHIDGLKNMLDAVRYHHERYDGNGYPKGLRGDRIPLTARILTVADSYDAMVSKRPYKDEMAQEQALDELKTCCGSQFDPQVVVAFDILYRNKLANTENTNVGAKQEQDLDFVMLS